MRQALKCLQVNVYRQREFKLLAVSAFSVNRQAQVSIVKQCYDALRVNAESEKLKIATTKLQNEVRPAVQALNFKIGNVTRKIEGDKTKRSTRCLANLFGKLLSGYFHHWRAQCRHNTIVIETNVARLISKLHRRNLTQAFNRWRAGRTFNVL